jgi:glycogen debranching enzyme
VPSFDLLSESFDRRRYWRGPIWINTNWLLWSGLDQHGRDSETDDILLSTLRLVERSGFREYFDPLDGTGYGSDGFGWTAALTLDLIERYRGASRTRLLERLRAEAPGRAPAPPAPGRLRPDGPAAAPGRTPRDDRPKRL